MEPKPEPREPQQSPEVKDTPEHMFAKDQLGGISFLNPETNKRVTLKQRMGKVYPQYEAQVLARFDLLRTVEENRIASGHEEDAARRAQMIFRDWKNEQRKIKQYDYDAYDDWNYDKDAREDWQINAPVNDPDAPQEDKTHDVRVPPRPDGHIEEDDYSDKSSP